MVKIFYDGQNPLLAKIIIDVPCEMVTHGLVCNEAIMYIQTALAKANIQADKNVFSTQQKGTKIVFNHWKVLQSF